MNFNEFIVLIVTGIVSLLIGGWITSTRAKYKEKKMRRQLEELDYKERFLEKISKGNVELLRVSFKILSFSLELMAFSAGAFTVTTIKTPLVLPGIIVSSIRMLVISAMMLVGAICFSHFGRLIRLNNLPKTKEKLNEKWGKLSEQLNKISST